MKQLLLLAFCLALGACSGMSVVESRPDGQSFSLGGAPGDARWRDPKFYANDGEAAMPWLKSAPMSNR